MDSVRLTINQSLFEEWGAERSDGEPSEDWPYPLEHWGNAEGWDIYRFDDNGVGRYAGYAEGVGVISGAVAGMTFMDLCDEFRGGEWILDRQPVDLNDPDADDEASVPPYDERLAAVEDLIRDAFGEDAEYWILRGYYLCKTRSYLAIVQQTRARGETTVVGTGIQPVTVGFRKASPERRLAIAVARHLIDRKG
ncbi:MAG: hypothetical protein OEN55_11850 [Alphaproteobacteria bacterium]|nr:hypothetical protein [Alphaproteobacteria bacterium]